MKERLIWLVALVTTQWLYFPINRLVEGGVAMVTPWDRYVPFWPIWAVPYVLSLLWWQAAFAWATWQMSIGLFRAFAIATISVMLVSYVTYVAYPTYVIRPELSEDNWQTRLVQTIYANDRVHNAFPSGHTYLTVLISLFYGQWRPRQRLLWIAIAIMVVLSTLFTGQHHLPDPIGGVVIAWLGFRFGIWAEKHVRWRESRAP